MVVVLGFSLSPLTIQTNMDNTSNSVSEYQSLFFKSVFAQNSELDNNDESTRPMLSNVSDTTLSLAFLISAISIIVILYLFKILSKRSLKEIILNDKGYPTLSKFQFLLWTLVIAFTYLSLQIIIVVGANYSDATYLLKDPPVNLLALMGISVAVPLIAAGKTNRMKMIKKQDDSKAFGSMFLNLNGKLDLARFQMFLWTIIGIGIYLHTVFDEVFTLNTSEQLFLPDVAPVLVFLMGLSQAAYLGQKYVGSDSQENNSVPNDSENPDNK